MARLQSTIQIGRFEWFRFTIICETLTISENEEIWSEVTDT